MDLRLLNKRHLEQYVLSLDRCEYSRQIIETANRSPSLVWNHFAYEANTTNASRAFKRDMEQFRQGRIGDDDIHIAPVPAQLNGQWMIEECGMNHRFPGRVCLISENGQSYTATFVVDKLRLTKGNWYFCIRLLESRLAQIGWATDGFNPTETNGIGNDKYSWALDGSTGMLYHEGAFHFLTEDKNWNFNDVCGCGIEIDGVNTRIHYWLNGQFLGTAFAHHFPIGASNTICNMLPNGSETAYFPGVTLKPDTDQQSVQVESSDTTILRSTLNRMAAELNFDAQSSDKTLSNNRLRFGLLTLRTGEK
ncbi:unnamed protein product [Rotaria sp. Silwood1]|nr:unnamed protein product [Rotaria sp. Silwood1]CAF3861310.1 unnamed protein product [Rotaria sp. Silwood1]CAF4882257.1 unnamed protein product [Rotaria sp. Silwood1]